MDYLPDGNTSLAYAHVTEQHDFVVVNILSGVVVQRGTEGRILILVVSVACHLLILANLLLINPI